MEQEKMNYFLNTKEGQVSASWENNLLYHGAATS